jgi:S1-C subfamily serine protease
MKRFLFVLAIILIGAAVLQRFIRLPENVEQNLSRLIPKNLLNPSGSAPTAGPYKIEERDASELTNHEKTVTSVIEGALPSVVTIGIEATARTRDQIELDPFNPFSPFRRVPGEERTIEQNIGSGFIISADGLIISNRHVVDFEDATYNVLTNDGKEYEVQQIYRDPLNDLAILKINANNLKPLPLGNSSQLKLGQTAIAIGTPLGEFQNSVTTGIISGVGRGISAGSPFEGFVEKLDNVIQTDAAISPGNSGGPLLNSNGEVIGVNTAVSAEGQNIGFAIPSNVVRDLVDSFNDRGGSFERPYIGVRYKLIDRQTAVLNDLVEGAYVIEVIEGSPAETAEILEEDIIMDFDGQRITGSDDAGLAQRILEKRVGDVVRLRIWRNGEVLEKSVTMGAAE